MNKKLKEKNKEEFDEIDIDDEIIKKKLYNKKVKYLKRGEKSDKDKDNEEIKKYEHIYKIRDDDMVKKNKKIEEIYYIEVEYEQHFG